MRYALSLFSPSPSERFPAHTVGGSFFMGGMMDFEIEKTWDRYGMTESEWLRLSTVKRETHYVRRGVCTHEYEHKGPPGDNQSLRESYSFDPYSHTAHMDTCTKEKDCACQMCVLKIGIERTK